jgi:hypothetical protein
MLKEEATQAETQQRPLENKRDSMVPDWRSLAVIALLTALICIVIAGYSSNLTLEAPNGYRGSWQLERPSR